MIETMLKNAHQPKWEIDLVEGGKKTSEPVLLTLLERKTRKVIGYQTAMECFNLEIAA